MSSENLEKYRDVEHSVYDYAMLMTNDLTRNKNKAFEYYGNNISYPKSKKEIELLAKIFKKNNAKTGDVIAVISPSLPEVNESFYAINKNGCTFFPIDPRTNASRIKEFLNLAGVKQIVMFDQAFGKVDQIIDETKVENVLVVSAKDSMPFILGKAFQYNQAKKTKDYYELQKMISSLNHDEDEKDVAKALLVKYLQKNKYSPLSFEERHIVKNLKLYEDLKTVAMKNLYYTNKPSRGYISLAEAKEQVMNDSSFASIYDDNVPASLTLTSGTTGKPKVVPTMNRSYNVKVRDYTTTTLPIERGDRILSMPPFILYGETFLHMAYCRGVQSVIIPDITAYKYGDIIINKKINHAVGVPSHMLSLTEDERFQKKIPSFIKSISVGGTKMLLAHELKINKTFEKKNIMVTQGYSMTELTPSSFTNMPNYTKVQSVGQALGDTKALIISKDTGEILGPNQKGMLFIHSETQFKGYYKNPVESEKVLKEINGQVYVNTGDNAYLDDDGYCFILDREKDMIIRPDGHNVFPSEIEEIISQDDAVSDCAVVGVPYPSYDNPEGEYAKAHVVLKDKFKGNEYLVEERLKNLCSASLPERDVAYYYEFHDELPLTPVGKYDKEALKKHDKSLSEAKTLKKVKKN